MKKLCLALILLFLGSQAYADDIHQFNRVIWGLHTDRARLEAKFGLDPNATRFPYATCYYDDLVDHYEQDQIMSDFIDAGIR